MGGRGGDGVGGAGRGGGRGGGGGGSGGDAEHHHRGGAGEGGATEQAGAGGVRGRGGHRNRSFHKGLSGWVAGWCVPGCVTYFSTPAIPKNTDMWVRLRGRYQSSSEGVEAVTQSLGESLTRESVSER